MAGISVEYLRPGMTLNSDVMDRNGRLLLNAGAEITEKHIYIFKTWGIMEVDIQGVTEEDVAVAVQIDPLVLQKAEEELNGIFLHTDRQDPVIKEIFRLCAIRKAHSLSGEEGDGKQSA